MELLSVAFVLGDSFFAYFCLCETIRDLISFFSFFFFFWGGGGGHKSTQHRLLACQPLFENVSGNGLWSIKNANQVSTNVEKSDEQLRERDDIVNCWPMARGNLLRHNFSLE